MGSTSSPRWLVAAAGALVGWPFIVAGLGDIPLDEGLQNLVECRDVPRPVALRASLLPKSKTPDVFVGLGPASAVDEEPCRAVWISHEEIAEHEELFEAALNIFDVVFTDSLDDVPFGARTGKLHFLESVAPLPDQTKFEEELEAKDEAISVLLPPAGSAEWQDPVVLAIERQALKLIPEHTYREDGTASGYREAFGKYRFSIIAHEEAGTVSQAFVQALGHHTVPLFTGFERLTTLLPRGVVPYNRTFFSLELLLSKLEELEANIKWLWNYHRMSSDQLGYRYNQPFPERLASAACTACRALGSVGRSSATDLVKEKVRTPLPLVFVGIYSGKGHLDRRQALRDTWLRIFKDRHDVVAKFFLGDISLSAKDDHIRQEMQKYNDLVVLGVKEGYEKNSAKGLSFLEWCAKHVLAEFLIKTDDDIYLRPGPLVEILRHRPNWGYAWGYWDFMSPVPRDETSPFYNPPESYPFQAFPAYPRGLVRALSMDVVRRIARAGAGQQLSLIFGDDPCLGVHLRQVAFSSEDPLPMLNIDDRDSYRAFAMEPSCNTGLWSHVSGRTWVVHHVTPEQIRCMWEADLAAGYHVLREDGKTTLSKEAAAGARMVARLGLARGQRGEKVQEPPDFPLACRCLEEGPLAAALSERKDKVNASSTYQLWGDPNFAEEDVRVEG